jgi:hypothetical protein
MLDGAAEPQASIAAFVNELRQGLHVIVRRVAMRLMLARVAACLADAEGDSLGCAVVVLVSNPPPKKNSLQSAGEVKSNLKAASFLRPVRWPLNTICGKRSRHPTPRTCGLGVWWF